MEEYSNKNNEPLNTGVTMKNLSEIINNKFQRKKNESKRHKGFTGTAMVNG
jgi:hypothetical protein